MKYLIAFQIIILTILFGSCQKESQELQNSPSLVWRSSISTDEYTGSIAPIVYEDIVVYSKNSIVNIQEPLIGYNRHTGEKLWEWADFLGDVNQFWMGDSYLYKNIWVVSAGPRVYGIDIRTGKTLWNSWDFVSSGNKDVTGIGEMIFHVEYEKGTFNNYLRMGNVYSDDWETIFTTRKDSAFHSILTAVTPYTDANGDVLLIFTEGLINYEDKKSGNNLYVYNLKNRKVLFEIPYHIPDHYVAGYVHRPFVYQERIYASSGKSVYCFDLKSGEQIWKRSFRETPSQVMMADGVLLVNNNDLTLYALDPLTGYYIWTSPAGGSCSKMYLVDGIVYYTNSSDGQMYAVRLEDGEVIWNYENPDRQMHDGAFFGAAMTVGPEGKYIYTYNFLDALCFETLKQ